MFNSVQLSLRLLSRSKFPRLQKLETIIRKENVSGWVHRRPIAVINEKITFDNEDESSKPERKLKPRKYIGEDLEHRPMKEKLRHRPPTMAQSASIESDETYNEDGTLKLHNFTQDEKKLSALIMGVKSRKKREKTKQILLEGYRLIQDAIQAGLVPQIIMFSRMSDIAKFSLPKKGVKVYRVPYATLQMWSSLTSSPGLFGIFQCPDELEKDSNADTLPLTIICDNVREPGNMGAIIRAAAAVGCERIILMKGCVDVWETKVLRSAAGAHFRVPISKSVEWDEIDSLINSTAKIYVADNDTAIKSTEASDNSNTKNQCGSNDENIQQSVKPEAEEDPDMSDKSSADQVECVSEETLENSDKSDSEKYIYDKNFEKRISSAEDAKETSPKLQMIIAREMLMRIPIIPYYAPDYTANEVVLIVGGETEGLSYESVELVNKHEGVRVNIPLTNEVESLNTGMALGIVVFEVKKQFTMRKQSIE